jgi:uncharacterized protein with HEPN domain
MNAGDSVRLRHMLDHSREAVGMVRGRTRRNIEEDRLLQLAVTRLLGIVGEASSRVSAEGRVRAVGIPWQDIMVTTRDRVIRHDFSIDCDSVWRIVNGELPPLIVALERALSEYVS